MNIQFYLRFLLGTLILSLLYTLFNYFLGLSGFNLPTFSGLLSNLLVVIALGAYINYSNQTGWQLVLIVFSIYFVIGHFNILIEAYIFNVTDRKITSLELLRGFLVSVAFAPLFVYILGKWNQESNQQIPIKRSIWGWIWRITLGDLLYFIFYATAGMILVSVYPELLDFYEGQNPSF